MMSKASCSVESLYRGAEHCTLCPLSFMWMILHKVKGWGLPTRNSEPKKPLALEAESLQGTTRIPASFNLNTMTTINFISLLHPFTPDICFLWEKNDLGWNAVTHTQKNNYTCRVQKKPLLWNECLYESSPTGILNIEYRDTFKKLNDSGLF